MGSARRAGFIWMLVLLWLTNASATYVSKADKSRSLADSGLQATIDAFAGSMTHTNTAALRDTRVNLTNAELFSLPKAQAEFLPSMPDIPSFEDPKEMFQKQQDILNGPGGLGGRDESESSFSSSSSSFSSKSSSKSSSPGQVEYKAPLLQQFSFKSTSMNRKDTHAKDTQGATPESDSAGGDDAGSDGGDGIKGGLGSGMKGVNASTLVDEYTLKLTDATGALRKLSNTVAREVIILKFMSY
eukprot:1334659-Amorphochlora_amoeboformis.AAC.2